MISQNRASENGFNVLDVHPETCFAPLKVYRWFAPLKVRDDFAFRQGFASNETTGVMDMSSIDNSTFGLGAQALAALEDGTQAWTRLARWKALESHVT